MARRTVLNEMRSIENVVRAVLREAGIKLGTPSRTAFAGRVRELAGGDALVMALVEPLLAILATMHAVEDDGELAGDRDTLQVARWLPNRRIVAVGDRAFSAIDLLDVVRTRICMVTRLRLDARLFAPATPREAGTQHLPCTVDQGFISGPAFRR